MLPQQEQSRLRRAYQFRIAALGTMMASLVMLVAVALLLPAYILTSIRRQTVADRLKMLDTREIDSKVGSLNSIITDINDRLKIFKKPNEIMVVSSDMLLPVLAQTKSTLLVNSFSTDRTPEGLYTISVGGVAKNREALLMFERALRATPTFTGVDVPISNFVRGSDILFSMQFTKTSETNK